jgi:hypothetical protein
MRFTPLLALLSCLVTCSCGAASTQEGGEKSPAVTAPAIEAIDEPASEDVEYLWSRPSEVAVATHFLCLDGESYETDDEPCEPSREEIEELRHMGEKIEQAIRPAQDSEPRKIARLLLTARRPKSQAFLIAWRNRAGKLCLADSEEDEEGGGGGGGAFGPCEPEGRCGAICLIGSGTGSGQESLYSTSGVVASKADALRITFDDGHVVTYELTGPLVPGYPEYRVFMLDLGRDIETDLELLRKERVIAEEKRSRAEVRGMRCSERAPLLPPEEEQERETAWKACMRETDSK